MLGVLAVLEIAVHPEFHQLVANTPKQELEHPVENNNQNFIIQKKANLSIILTTPRVMRTAYQAQRMR